MLVLNGVNAQEASNPYCHQLSKQMNKYGDTCAARIYTSKYKVVFGFEFEKVPLRPGMLLNAIRNVDANAWDALWSIRCPALCGMKLGTAKVLPIFRNSKKLLSVETGAQLHSMTSIQVKESCNCVL